MRLSKLVVLLGSLVAGSVFATPVELTLSSSASAAVTGTPIFRTLGFATEDVKDFSVHQVLYQRAALATHFPATGASLTSIAFEQERGFAMREPGARLQIFLKNSSAPSYSATETLGQARAGATLVYETDEPDFLWYSGYVTFTFSTPFMYSGDGLEVLVIMDSSAINHSSPSTHHFRWMAYGFTNSGRTYRDAAAPSDSSVLTNTEPNSSGSRPNTRLVGSPLGKALMLEVDGRGVADGATVRSRLRADRSTAAPFVQTLRNAGTAPLTISSIALGAVANVNTTTTPPTLNLPTLPLTLAPGATTTFGVSVLATSATLRASYEVIIGTDEAAPRDSYTATINAGLASNAPVDLVYSFASSFNFTWDRLIETELNTATGGSSPSPVFGPPILPGETRVIDITTRNLGLAPLTLGDAEFDANDAGVQWDRVTNVMTCGAVLETPTPTNVLARDESVLTRVRLTVPTNATGSCQFDLWHVIDPFGPYAIMRYLAQIRTMQAIEVSRGAVLVDGAVDDVGVVAMGSETQLTWLVRDTGTQPLGLSDAVLGNVTGCTAVVRHQPLRIAGPGQATRITVGVTPTGAAPFSFTLSLPHSVVATTPFDLTVQGVGGTPVVDAGVPDAGSGGGGGGAAGGGGGGTAAGGGGGAAAGGGGGGAAAGGGGGGAASGGGGGGAAAGGGGGSAAAGGGGGGSGGSGGGDASGGGGGATPSMPTGCGCTAGSDALAALGLLALVRRRRMFKRR